MNDQNVSGHLVSAVAEAGSEDNDLADPAAGPASAAAIAEPCSRCCQPDVRTISAATASWGGRSRETEPQGRTERPTHVRDLLRNLTGTDLMTTSRSAPLTTASRKSGAGKPLRIRTNDEIRRDTRGGEMPRTSSPRHRHPALPRPPARGLWAGRKAEPEGTAGRKGDPRGRISDPLSAPDLRERGLIFPPSTNSSLLQRRGRATRRGPPGQEAAAHAVLASWAVGAGRARPAASVRRRLAAQVPALLEEFSELRQLQQIAHFARSHRWTDLGRAALHPNCVLSLSPKAGAAPDAAGGSGREVQKALLAQIGVTGAGL